MTTNRIRPKLQNINKTKKVMKV